MIEWLWWSEKRFREEMVVGEWGELSLSQASGQLSHAKWACLEEKTSTQQLCDLGPISLLLLLLLGYWLRLFSFFWVGRGIDTNTCMFIGVYSNDTLQYTLSQYVGIGEWGRWPRATGALKHTHHEKMHGVKLPRIKGKWTGRVAQNGFRTRKCTVPKKSIHSVSQFSSVQFSSLQLTPSTKFVLCVAPCCSLLLVSGGRWLVVVVEVVVVVIVIAIINTSKTIVFTVISFYGACDNR